MARQRQTLCENTESSQDPDRCRGIGTPAAFEMVHLCYGMTPYMNVYQICLQGDVILGSWSPLLIMSSIQGCENICSKQVSVFRQWIEEFKFAGGRLMGADLVSRHTFVDKR